MSGMDQRTVYQNRRRKRKRKAKIRKVTVCLVTVAVTAAVIVGIVKLVHLILPTAYDNGFVPTSYGKTISKQVKKAQGLTVPDWIDQQIIQKHSSARTGAHLSDIKNIVIHYVANPGTSAQNNRDYFNKLSTGVSAHFLVGLEGEIIQCIPLWEKSAASNDRNIDTISIEVCHPDETGKFNTETYQSLLKLCQWLCGEFDLKGEDLIRHYDITGKICPKYFVDHPEEWEQFKTVVQEGLDSN